MRKTYEAWLRSQGYDSGTVTAQLHRVGRVEQYYGDLERHLAADGLRSVFEALRYSTEDERRARPNPTPIPINGVLRSNLASYRHAVQLYGRFLTQSGAPATARDNTPGAARSPVVARKVEQPPAVPPEHARTFSEFGFDGEAALQALVAASRYRTLAQAVAALTVFSHPQTVAETQGRGIFPTVRGTPGVYEERGGRPLMLDDNKSPTDAFLWANGLGRRGRDTQFNHVYAVSGDPEAYTALPNICMTPAFLAKLTDTNPDIRALLAFRSFDLYGWTPGGKDRPERPQCYASLEWAAPLPYASGVRDRMLAIMARRPKDRTAIAAARLGWLFEPFIEDAGEA